MQRSQKTNNSKMPRWLVRKVMASVYIFLCSCTSVSGANCIVFSAGEEINNGKEFVSRFRLENDVKNIELYTAAYDLNKDGYPEYFYHIESPKFCGMRTGCDIGVYEYRGNRFRELIKYGLTTFNKFDPTKKEHVNYICVGDAVDNGWLQLIIQEKQVYSYDGTYYVAEGKH